MNSQEIKERKNFLTIQKKSYNHTLGRNVDVTYRFFDKKTDILPPTIDYTFWNWKALEPLKWNLWLKVNETTPENKEKFKEMILLQEETMRIIKKRNEQFNYRCWLLSLTTWSGKWHLIIDITEYYQVETLILVHNTKTLHELIKKFEDFTNIKPAQYGDGKKEIWPVTVMTKTSFWWIFWTWVLEQELRKLYYKVRKNNITQDFYIKEFEKISKNIEKMKLKQKHFKSVSDFKCILIDEAPVQFSQKFWEGVNLFFDGIDWVALYGLSGTAYKIELTQTDLEKFFGKTIEVKQKENNGYNYKPKITMYDYMVDKWRYEYESPAEMRSVVSEDIQRLWEQLVQVKNLSRNRKCTLILTDRRSEADNFMKHNFWLWFCFLIHGDTKRKEDEENIKKARGLVKKGEKVCIIWTIQKVGVWVDIPFIDTIFLASAIKFWATVIQWVWRGLRLYEGKEDVKVWVWNDLPTYKGQRYEKLKVIKSEYGILDSEIEIIKINKKVWKK